MSKRVLAVLALAVLPSLAACDRATSPNVAYTSPGWYIERPRITLAAGPQIFAGPFTSWAWPRERLITGIAK